MPSPLPTQLHLPLEIATMAPPLPQQGKPTIRPEELWRTVLPADRTSIRTIRLTVLREATNEQR